MKINVLAALKWVGAAIAAWWIHDVPLAMHTLIWLMGVDYATGLVAALLEGTLCSRVGLRGLLEKCAIVCFLLFGHRVEQLIGHEVGAEIFGAIGISVNEFISIVKNFVRLGVPLPESAINILAALRTLCVKRATAEQLRRLKGW